MKLIHWAKYAKNTLKMSHYGSFVEFFAVNLMCPLCADSSKTRNKDGISENERLDMNRTLKMPRGSFTSNQKSSTGGGRSFPSFIMNHLSRTRTGHSQ